jgi:hypothetical protein
MQCQSPLSAFPINYIPPTLCLSQIWRVTPAPKDDKHQYTYFAHKINSFDTAPKKLLASDSRLRPDRYALEKGDMSKSGTEKSRYFSPRDSHHWKLHLVTVLSYLALFLLSSDTGVYEYFQA